MARHDDEIDKKRTSPDSKKENTFHGNFTGSEKRKGRKPPKLPKKSPPSFTEATLKVDFYLKGVFFSIFDAQ